MKLGQGQLEEVRGQGSGSVRGGQGQLEEVRVRVGLRSGCLGQGQGSGVRVSKRRSGSGLG